MANLSRSSEGAVWPCWRRPSPGHEERHVDGFLDVAPRLLEHLAHLAGHVAREALLALDQQLGRTEEDLGPLRRRDEPPALERPGRGRNGPLGIGARGLREVADEVVGVRGVPVLEDLAGRRRHPLAVDEVLERDALMPAIIPSRGHGIVRAHGRGASGSAAHRDPGQADRRGQCPGAHRRPRHQPARARRSSARSR